MSDNTIGKNHLSQMSRPIGVWIITIYALLFAASNLLGDSFLVLKGEVAMFSSDAVPRMLLWAYLNIAIIIASILTWVGWKQGRIFFLFLTFIFYLNQAIGMFLWIINRYFGKAPIGEQINSWFLFIGYILIPVLYIWYFNKPSTKEFYQKPGRVFLK